MRFNRPVYHDWTKRELQRRREDVEMIDAASTLDVVIVVLVMLGLVVGGLWLMS